MSQIPLRPSVLVVDDDNFMRRTLCDALEEQGFLAVAVQSGAEALEWLQFNRPDLILLDVMMPDLDGFATCRMIRVHGEGKHIPVIMLTALEDTDSIFQAYEAGATDFITKPINHLLMGQRLRYILRANHAFEGLRRSQRKLNEAQKIARLGNWDWELDADCLLMSAQTAALLGIDTSCAEFEGTWGELLERVHPEDRTFLETAVARNLKGGEPFSLDFRIQKEEGGERFFHCQGEAAFNQLGRPTNVFGTFQDITERRRAEEKIRFLAYFDSLTQLPNRAFFSERLNYVLAYARRYSRRFALLFMDLDRFKLINDSLGHAVGDLLLQQVARRLESILRHTDLIAQHGIFPEEEERERAVARLGGDEFTLWVSDIQRVEDVVKVAQRILRAFSTPFRLRDEEIFVTPSIGIAIYPDDGDNVESLLKNADAAMYYAKDQGRNNYQFYSEKMNATASRMLELENSLHRAIERNELLLQYQPQFDLASGRVAGVEALLRWRLGGTELLQPDQFISLAEDTGLIVPVGEWVLREACRQMREWDEGGLQIGRVAVNLSSRQFWNHTLSRSIGEILRETGLPPSRLQLEITENVLMEDTEGTITLLRALKEMGIGFAIDDFGSGYSSLNYLRRFPVDLLKIDRSFTLRMETEHGNADIIAAITAMAHSLNLKVLAEGVETTTQLDYLRKVGCDEVQGFLLGKPLLPGELPSLVKSAPWFQ